MLIPRFTLRAALKWITYSACFFLVLAWAISGAGAAIVISVAVLSVLGMLLVHAAFFVACFVLSRAWGTHQLPARTAQGGVQTSPDEHLRP
jgi:hypothetical protein